MASFTAVEEKCSKQTRRLGFQIPNPDPVPDKKKSIRSSPHSDLPELGLSDSIRFRLSSITSGRGLVFFFRESLLGVPLPAMVHSFTITTVPF
jgi:hypothetical protein